MQPMDISLAAMREYLPILPLMVIQDLNHESIFMKILVTGSEGLIGSNLCRTLRTLGHDITGLDLKPSSIGSDGIQGTIMDIETLRPACRDISGIVHLEHFEFNMAHIRRP